LSKQNEQREISRAWKRVREGLRPTEDVRGHSGVDVATKPTNKMLNHQLIT